MIELKHVSMAYGAKRVFADFSLSLPERGEYAVLGPSGCGKTTLLRLIAGLETPQSGQILRPDAPIAFCFQEDRLLPWRTVRENIALALPAGARRDAARAARLAQAWLERVGLPEEGDAWPSSLSGGMKRRAALARALAFDAPVLLMDEPFRALDDAAHTDMLRLVRQCAQGKLLVLVTHEQRDAEGMHILRM